MSDYGRFIDKDGLPNWKLPPESDDPKGWSSMIDEAVREMYADHGGKWLTERLGLTSTARERRQVYWRAKWDGIRVKKEVISSIRSEMSRKRPRRGMGYKARFMRYRLANECGYIYGTPPVMYYDDRTTRRLERTRKYRQGFEKRLESELEEKYGIVFKPFQGRKRESDERIT